MGYLKDVEIANAEIAISRQEFLALPRNKQAAYLKKYPNSKYKRRGPGGEADRKKDATALKKKPTEYSKRTPADVVAKLREELSEINKSLKENTRYLTNKDVSPRRLAEIKKYIEHLKLAVAKKKEAITAAKKLVKKPTKETALAKDFPSLTNAQKEQIKNLFFKGDVNGLKALMNDKKNSADFRGYAKESYEELLHMNTTRELYDQD